MEKPLWQRAAYRGRYFWAYGFTIGALALPTCFGRMDYAAYAVGVTSLFGALVGVGAAIKRRKPQEAAGSREDVRAP